MANKQKLELTWIGKENRPRLEPRILLEDSTKSYHAKHRVSKDDIFDNRLIFGDNLLALKALEQEFSGKVKCIYIDPPYNTGNAFEYYDDGLENSIWLALIRDRLEILWKLLTPDGFLAVQIDDKQFARLYLIMIELFRETNLKTICIKMSEPTGVKMASVNKIGSLAKLKEYVILAGKNGIRNLKVERIPKEKWDDEYRTVLVGITKDQINLIKDILDNEDRSEQDIVFAENLLQNVSFESSSIICRNETGGELSKEWQYENSYRIIQFATITGGARDIARNRKRSFASPPPAFLITTSRKKAYLIKGNFNDETNLPRCKVLFAEDYLTTHPGDLWTDIKTTGLDNEGVVEFPNGKKPEALVKRIIGMATNPGDLVLDSFAGSGTTGAVAHKMGRRWIMVELGEHCHTHIIPRIKKVIDGEDKNGITEAVNWKGGGGFRYYKVAPSLLEKDKWGNWVINKEYNSAMLAEAVCKLEGFSYEPSDSLYWMHGKSTETDFIYVTTQNLNRDQLALLSDEVGCNRSLLVMCSAFRAKAEDFSNLTIKKIPNTVLAKCEWGHDDYSLQVENLPAAPKPERKQRGLFDEEVEE